MNDERGGCCKQEEDGLVSDNVSRSPVVKERLAKL